jgi:hypothetical protein
MQEPIWQKSCHEKRAVMRFIRLALLLVVVVELLSVAGIVDAQDLGHRLPGLIGLDAGTIAPPGLSVLDRFAAYNADELRDRNGNIVPIGPELRVLSNAVGISYTYRLPQSCTTLSARAAAPVAGLRLNVQDVPAASVDKFGLADIYIQPLEWGCEKDRFEILASYSLYVPTGQFLLAGGKSVSSGNVTHQFSFGGTIYRSKERTSFISALASYELNLRKRNIDITRGDIFQIQGGIGVKRHNQVLEMGLAGYALWQVRDDRGADLPPVLSGARDRVFGLGPEVAVLIKSINSELRARYEWDIGAQSRFQGNVFVVGIKILVKHPRQPAQPAP